MRTGLALLAAAGGAAAVTGPLTKCKKAKSCAECMDDKHDFLGCGWCTKKQKCHERAEIETVCSLNCVGKLMDLPNCRHKCPAAPTPPAPGPAPPAPSGQHYSCIPGQASPCVPCSGPMCDYDGLAACQAGCGAAPPAPGPAPPSATSYACVGNQCVAATAGGVNRAACCQSCGCANYACVAGTCSETSVGGVPRDQCEAQCGAAPPAPRPPAPGPAPAPPAPAPPAPASGGPQAGELYCGSVGGGIILKTNLTIHAGSTMEYHNHIVVASTLVACPSEPFVFQPGVGCDPTVKGKAGCGTMDFSKAVADPNDCLAKAGQSEGGATHTFIYNGDEAKSIDSKDSKYGTVTMTLSTASSC